MYLLHYTWRCNILCSKHDIDMRMNEWNRHALFLSWNGRNGYLHYLRYLCLLVYSGVHHMLCCVFLRIVYPMLPVSPDCPFLIAPSVFSNVWSGISSTRERNSAYFHSFRYAPLVKRHNFSHSWKKSQIFNRDSCKNLLFFSITCCVVFFFVLCTLCCQFLRIVHFWLPLQYSLTCIMFGIL
jgi:hypothetical protein